MSIPQKYLLIDSGLSFSRDCLEDQLSYGTDFTLDHYLFPEQFIVAVIRGETKVSQYDLMLHDIEFGYPIANHNRLGFPLPWMMKKEGFNGIALIRHIQYRDLPPEVFTGCGFDGFVNKFEDISGYVEELRRSPQNPDYELPDEVRSMTWTQLLNLYFIDDGKPRFPWEIEARKKAKG